MKGRCLRILVVGSGGREHAIIWKLSAEAPGRELLCLPGNAGISELAEIVDSVDASDVDAVVRLARERQVDLVVIGPEQPLVDGLSDALAAAGIKVFGPSASAARLEGSKVFTKEFLARHNIPSASFRVFDDEASAVTYVRELDGPCVVKADGLAAGKGVIVASTAEEAEEGVRDCFSRRRFGSAGDKVLIEERLTGWELSLLAITDGKTVLPLAPAQDHKPVFDGNQGPNTGGMGCYSPVPAFTPQMQEEVMRDIVIPTVTALASEGIEYRGVLYTGLMMTESGPQVLEFNCRFGDPEAETIIPRMKSDLLSVMLATAGGSLDSSSIDWTSEASVNVVMCSPGYPGDYPTGAPIAGIADAVDETGAMVFHSGTDWNHLSDGRTLVTAGGRVLNVCALGADLAEARRKAYDAVELIDFEGAHHRLDIAADAAHHHEVEEI